MTDKVIIERFCYAQNCSIGVLYVEGKKFYTIERPWIGNARNISCIPEGTFLCKRYNSGKHGSTFEIIVPNRDYILFHVANKAEEVEGCVGVAKYFSEISLSIVSSRIGFGEFLDLLSDIDEFTLTVRQYRPN